MNNASKSKSNSNRAEPLPRPKQNVGRYFVDEKRLIDYVLVYKDVEDEEKAYKRTEFEEKLKALGFELQEGPLLGQEKRTVLVHCPFNVLSRHAEIASIRKPVSVNDLRMKMVQARGSINRWFDLPTEIYQRSDMFSYYYATYNEKTFEDIIENKEDFFTSAERIRIVFNILSKIKLDNNDKTTKESEKFGIDHLVESSVYHDYFPLHDALINLDKEDFNNLSDRELLYHYWTFFKCMFIRQPYDLIQSYFGSKIGFYFAWLGYYTRSLLLITILGLLVVLSGFSFTFTDDVTEQICDQDVGGAMILCVMHEHAQKLSTIGDGCGYSWLNSLFDNPTIVITAVLVTIWSTVSLEMWKNITVQFRLKWQLLGYEQEDEVVRPQFQQESHEKFDPYLQQHVSRLSPLHVLISEFVSWAAILFFICLVAALAFGMIVYQLIVSNFMKHQDPNLAMFVRVVSTSFINLAFIILMNFIYEKIAYKLTVWQCPRTQTDFDNLFAIKIFGFQFVNNFSSLFYIAFFKGRFAGHPHVIDNTFDDPKYFAGYKLFKYRTEMCNTSGCMVELLIQLIVIMCGKQFVLLLIELAIPTASHWWRRYKLQKHLEGSDTNSDADSLKDSKKSTLLKTPQLCLVARNYSLNRIPSQHLVPEYLDMVLQFAFCALFTASFPLAPLFAFINNLFEIRVDSYKIVRLYRRGVPQTSQGIGIWEKIIDLIASLSVLVNALVIAFTTELIPKFYHILTHGSLDTYLQDTFHRINITSMKYVGNLPPDNEYCYYKTTWTVIDDKFVKIMLMRLAFTILFEHFVIMIKKIIVYSMPELPIKTTALLKRQKFLAKQANLDKAGQKLHMKLVYQAGEEASDRDPEDTSSRKEVEMKTVIENDLPFSPKFYSP